MNPMKLFSLGMMAAGSLCLLSALGSIGEADSCSPTYYSPYTCKPAYELNTPNASTSQCTITACGMCKPAKTNGCGGAEIYGIAMPGECVLQNITSEPIQCWKDYGLTVVEINRWRYHCISIDGNCVCEAEATDGAPQYLQVCTCRDEFI
jgi:hypothetical protein